eukprot:4320910-Prymnesium_polylepis.1
MRCCATRLAASDYGWRLGSSLKSGVTRVRTFTTLVQTSCRACRNVTRGRICAWVPEQPTIVVVSDFRPLLPSDST